MIIDTKAIDAYRQGVEITQFKHYDAGIVKIHAGEIGHVLKKNRAGEDRHYRTELVYSDVNSVNPELRVSGKDNSTIINTDMLDGRVEDGVIEPLTIRSIARRERSMLDHEPHQIYGSLSAGTELQHCSSSPVVIVDYFKKGKSGTTFNDCMEYFRNLPIQHKTELTPYVDIRSDLESSSQYATTWRETDVDGKFLPVVSSMAGARDSGYVSLGQVSAAAGWVYDSSVGTDSIAFGGMTY